ncbi:hypothetical protein FACS189413_02760 [Bacteroidia bacterium]|nr:hypothetical protein FACS189413_02760 [Bacteroidia bacterium]
MEIDFLGSCVFMGYRQAADYTAKPARQNKNLIVMNKNVFFIIYLSAFLLVGCGKHTNSIHLELNLANKTLQDSLQYEYLMTVFDTVSVSNKYKNTRATTDTTTVLNTIVKHTDDIVRQTKPSSLLGSLSWNDWYALFIAIFACFISYLAYKWTKKGAEWQEQAELNTRAIRQIQKEQQGYILFDFIRHLYRNKVIICALQWQLDKYGYETHYPSDEHILKLQIPLEELALDRFANSSNSFNDLHKLKLLCRNTNIEVEVAYTHLKAKNFPVDGKKYSLETLEYKCGLLTDTIIQLMYDLNLFKEEKKIEEIEKIKAGENYVLPIYKNDDKVEKHFKEKDNINERIEFLQKIRTLLYKEIIKNNENHSLKFKEYAEEKKYRKEEKNYQRKKTYYDDILQISDQLNYDIYVEGEKKHDDEKGGKGVIKVIKFEE